MEPGSLVYDTATGRVGEYRDKTGPYAMLRPVGGGREWQADPAALRPATDRERLRAEVRAANGRALALPPDPADLGRPPVPLLGCAECAELGDRREAARAGDDLSTVTDANVLLRQHQRQEHLSSTRRVFRYVPYVIAQDEHSAPEYAARCVSGDEQDCGAESGVCVHPADVEEWQRKHTQETRHTRYRRVFTDYAVLTPA